VILEENKPLAPFTTLGIGGPARWFTRADGEEDVAEAAAWVREKDVRLFVLGGGSNILVSDAGFDGLVLQIGIQGVTKMGSEHSTAAGYQVAAGEDWDSFVERTVGDNCAGLECLAGIPGTVGGTPVQNVGAYGQEVATAIERVRAFDLEDHSYVEFVTEECGFAYRQSRFNTTDKERYVVTRVDYRLIRGGAPTLRYVDLQRAFAEIPQPSLKEVAAKVRQIRRSKGMLLQDGDPDCRSAGSFFKNPVVSEEQVRRISLSIGKQPPQFPAGQGKENEGRVKVPAAWLIEQAGFVKGHSLGAAGISQLHTLALINRGGATADEILVLAGQIRSAVTERFGIGLEMEPVMVGFG
jgi:UDP-N-acetylmuramate dehydrogenase